MKKFVFAAASLAAVSATTGAGATTYVLDRTINAGTAIGTITTDGTIGVLGNDNIADYTIEVSLAGLSRTITKADGSWSIVGTALTASATALTFNFDALSGNYAYFSSAGAFFPTFFCLQATSGGCIDANGPGEGVQTYNVSTRTARSGTLQFAQGTAAVPEPATWATMMFGFGVIGAGMRRRKQQVNVRFA
jgi:hypothetical protein